MKSIPFPLRSWFFLRKRNLFLFLTSLFLDRITKRLALRLFSGTALDLGPFSFVLYRNHGVSFSLFGQSPRLVLICSLTMWVIIVSIALYSSSIRSRSGFALLIAGATGNLLDRLMYGYVIDWLYIGVYINIADIALCLGAIMLMKAELEQISK